jgi:putative ABC transport system substrate-binding protein
METKRLALLHETVPQVGLIAVLLNPDDPIPEVQSREVNEAGRTLGQRLQIQHASTDRDLDLAFAAFVQAGAGALLVTADPLFNTKREKIIALATSHKLPAISDVREFAQSGGLMSYGTSLSDAFRQVGIYTGQILKGAKPADLPVLQASKFEFVINLKSAKNLGLEVPASLLARADELIE